MFAFNLMENKPQVSLPPPLPVLPWSLWKIATVFIIVEFVRSLFHLGMRLGSPIALFGLAKFMFISLGHKQTMTFFGLNHRLGGLNVLFGIRWTFIYSSGIFLLAFGILDMDMKDFQEGLLFQKVQSQWEIWGLWGLALTFFGDVVSGSLLEEFLFRGLLYNTIRKKVPMWPSVLIASMIFMLAHGPNHFGTFFLGIYFSLLVEKSQSLLPAISTHITHNSLVYARSIAVILFVPLHTYIYVLITACFIGILGTFLLEVWIRKCRNLPLGWEMVWSIPR